MWAAHKGHMGILQLLIERGVDVNETPRWETQRSHDRGG
ncbi:ankyrin repeat domain-containing protein [Corynebacterium mustelae]